VTGVLDSVGMFDLAAALPEQVAAAASLAAEIDELPDRDTVEQIVTIGMGGSGIGGDVVAAIASPFLPVPITAVKGYEIPSSIGPGTLCFATSASGDTEETVVAAEAAAAAGARMIVLSSGGALAERAAAWGGAHVPLPEIPMPRAGIGSVSIPPLVILERIGLLPGASQYVADAVDQLKRRRDRLIVDGGPAHVVAREIGRTMPVSYGGGDLGEVAAYRFKCQVNENAKAPSFAGGVPEMCHNEICGWGQHGDITRQVMTCVRFRHEFEHPQVARRFDLTFDVIDEVVHAVIDVEAEGEGTLAQLFDLIIQGDFISLHMAVEAGVDPGPIPVLTDLKAALAQ
jgi:glucose/mannose-6-phosphate isomerase